jgi:excisionase family DNA binding protein
VLILDKSSNPAGLTPGTPICSFTYLYISSIHTGGEFELPGYASLQVNKYERNKKLVYTSEEAAEVLVVSQRTISRMVKSGTLPRIGGMRFIRIPASGLEEFINGYNSDGAGPEVRNPQGERRCISARRKKELDVEKAVGTGGLPTQTQAVRELRNLLAPPTSVKQ